MRIKKLSCLLFIMSAALLSNNLYSQVQKLYLNPKAAGGENQSKFVDSIRFIPLEIKEGVHFEIYSNVQPTEKYFIVTDYLNKKLIFFKRNGAFITQISYKKFGDRFYPNYQKEKDQIVFFGKNKNYALTRQDEIKIEMDRNNPRNKKYFKKYIIDLKDTSFEIKESVPDENEIAGAFQYYDDYYFQSKIIASSLYKDSLDYELKLYKNNELVKAFFPYNHIHEPRYLYTAAGTYPIPTDTPYIRYVSRPYCDTIYKLIKDSLFPMYQVVLPLENTLPQSFFTKPFKNKTERDNFDRNNGWFLRQIYNFYETPRFISFLISYLSNYESYIYDRRSRTFYKTNKIKGDSTQYNLQLLSGFNTFRLGKKYYSIQKAEDLKNFFNTNKTIPVPKELEPYLKADLKKPNPVLIEYQLKN